MSAKAIIGVSLLTGMWLAAVTASAAPPAAALLPNSAKGFASTDNVSELAEHWRRSQYGQLLGDPVMQPFVEDFKRQMRENAANSHGLSITWEDVEAMAGGEAAVALVHPPQVKMPIQVMLIDITGKDDQAKAVLQRIAGENAKKQAVTRQVKVGDMTLTTYDFPKRRGSTAPAVQTVYFTKDNLLCACDGLDVAKGILGRWSGSEPDSLEAFVPYQMVMKRCQADAGEEKPHLRWFAVPLDLLTARRAMDPKSKPTGSRDYLKLLRGQGFTGIQGAGGYLNFSAGQFDLYHRLAIYAPPPWKLAMRMMEFPNEERAPPAPWVPADVASYVNLSWKMAHAFDMSKSIVDEIYGEEDILEEAIESLKADPDGPMVDLRSDLMAHLGTRAVVLFDYTVPTTTRSEQRIFAAECRDPQAVEVSLAKLMGNAPTKQHEVEGLTVWEVLESEDGGEEVPSLVVESPAGVPGVGEDEGPRPDDGPLLANSFLTVAHGYLFVASNLDLLKKALRKGSEQDAMAEDLDFRLVDTQIEAEIQRRGWEKVCLRRFSRTDQELRPTYELLQQGKMPQSESLLGQFLNSALGDSKNPKPREQRFDFSKLPPYDAARRYFGPAGLVVQTEDTGWFGFNFTLKKEGPVAQSR